MIDILIFYCVAGAVFGIVVASMDRVTFEFRGKPMRNPRLMSGIISAVIWPVVLWKMVMR